MGFECDLNLENINFEVHKCGDAYSLHFRIGHDNSQGKTYFSQIGLEVMAGGGLEYYFNILEVGPEETDGNIFWSGKETKNIIIGEDRVTVMSFILYATEFLLDHTKPKSVYRCTYDENPPDRSLEKHYLINEAFHKAGYEIAKGDPYGSKRWWWAYRIE